MTHKTMTRDEWMAMGEKLYGADPRGWKFKCPHCGHVQSGASVTEHNPALKDTSDWIYFACEGRHNKDYGCNWTLGGLFQIHKLVVVDGEHNVRCFEFADAPS